MTKPNFNQKAIWGPYKSLLLAAIRTICVFVLMIGARDSAVRAYESARDDEVTRDDDGNSSDEGADDDDESSDEMESDDESEQNDAEDIEDDPKPDLAPKPRSTQSRRSESDDGASMLFRMGVQTGDGIAQDRSLVPIELFPYILSDDSLYFTDLRFYSTDDLTLGGNAGLGYRRYTSGLDRIWGISGWYDGDQSREDNYLQQFGLSLETYGDIFDFRSNIYVPFGDTYQQASVRLVNNSAQFSGQNLLYDQVRSFYAAMKGFDLEAGVPIPGRFLEDHGVRVFGGMYHYADDHDETITGGSARLQANIASGLDIGMQVTHDSFYDTRAFVNVAWTFGPLHRSQMSQRTIRGRLGEHVTRNYTVLAPEHRNLEQNVVARDPQNGQAYRFAHVDSNASAGGTGDVDSPFQSITDAQAAGTDIVFVHAGSVFNGANATIVMNTGERILGDGNGIAHHLNVPDLGSLLIPHGPTSGAAPILNHSLGDSVTLASNSEFSNFTITNSVGSGVIGSGVEDVVLRNVTVQNSGGVGMQFLNSTGTIAITDSLIDGAAGEGLVFDGGDATIRYIGTLSSNNGHDLVVRNTGGEMDFRKTDFAGTGSEGILVDNVSGDVRFKDVSLDDTSGKGIEVVDVTGEIEFDGETFISGAGGNSIEVRNLGSDATVTFQDVEIHSRHDRGFVIDDNDGVVNVEGSLEVANEANVAASAIDVRNSSGNALLGPTVVTAVTGDPGVNIENNTGTTSISSLDLTGDGGTGLYANYGGTLRINPDGELEDGGEVNVDNGTAVDIEHTDVNVALRQVTSDNATVGLKLVSTTGTFGVYGDGAQATSTGGTISNSTTGIFLQNVENVVLVSMDLESNGVGIQTDDVDALGISNFRINNSTTYGIDFHNTRGAQVTYSTFTGNGLDDIRATFSEVATNSYSFSYNTFNTGGGDSLRFESQGGSAGAVLNLVVTSNDFLHTYDTGSAIDVDWNGTLSASVSQNGIIAQGDSSFGADISNAATASATSIVFSGNQFSGEADNTTLLSIVAAGPAQIAANSNLAQFSDTGGTGLRFSLGSSSTVNIANNNLVDLTDGATGILFDSLTGPTTIAINNNSIQLADSGGLTDRGIIFSSITTPIINSSTQFVTLSGTQSNTVLNADTPFSVLAGTTTGEIIINGVSVP